MQTNLIPEISGKALRKAKRFIAVPFQLKLRDYEDPIICEKIVRVIPGKRVVAFGTWNNQPIVAKLFYERGQAKKQSQRDAAGIENLLSVNIPTPNLLAKTTDSSGKIHILIFERIEYSCNLDWLWQEKADIEEIAPLMRAITVELATQHVLGVVQTDLHLKNFLITKNKIYTLDGGSIEKRDELLPKKESLEHLGLFFSQLGIGTEELQEQLFNLYAKSRGWIVRQADIDVLQNAIKETTEQRQLRYQKKILRACTAFARVEKFNSTTMYDRDYHSEKFFELLKNPDAFFLLKDTQILKAGHSATVAKVKVGSHYLVVKRYNIKGLWHWLRRCLRSTRGMQAWKLGHQLRHAGVPTAKPVAFIEKSFFGLNGKSYFIMEYVEGKHCGEYFAQFNPEDEQYPKMANRLLLLLNNLKKLRLTHGDLKMTNIIINHERPVLIDLDGMAEHTSQRRLERLHKKEMLRFMKNWDNLPQVRRLFES